MNVTRDRSTPRAHAAERAAHDRRQRALAEVVALERANLLSASPRVSGNWFENRLIELDAEVGEHPDVAALVSAYEHTAPPNHRDPD